MEFTGMFRKSAGHVCTGIKCKEELPTMYYDKAGTPIDREKWSELRQDSKYAKVEFENFPDINTFVSTIWVGKDYRLGLDLKPQIFVTTVSKDATILSMYRYTSLQEALDGHRRAAEQYNIRKSIQDELEALTGVQTVLSGVL